MEEKRTLVYSCQKNIDNPKSLLQQNIDQKKPLVFFQTPLKNIDKPKMYTIFNTNVLISQMKMSIYIFLS